MRLWKMELHKILGRPVLNFGFFLILAFQFIIFCNDVSGKQSEIDGNVYRGISAIEADRRLAEEYEGLFTLSQAEQIIKRFGFSGYRTEDGQKAPRYREGNFCSQWVTDNMTDFTRTEKKPAALKEGDAWRERGRQYLQQKMQFGYTAGWAYFHSLWSWSMLLLNIWLVLMVMPVFSEEYSRKTAHVLLTTVHGRSRDIWVKTAAAFALGITAFLLLTLWLLALTISVYGTAGMDASAGMFDYRALFAKNGGMTVGRYLLWAFAAKFAAVCLNVCVTLFFSSKCRNTVTGVVVRVAVLYPLAWLLNEIVYSMLFNWMYDSGLIQQLWGWAALDILGIVCSATTYYLSWSAVIGVPQNWNIIIAAVLTLIMTGSLWRAFVNYRKGT
ncbi:hypothetical protein AALA98_00870 [Lachnospiraceae bacterium 45-W7]